MRLIAFPQWDKLSSLLRGMARQSAAEYAQRDIVRIIPKNGVAHLADNAVNLLAVEGGKTTIVMPDMTPGKARDFMLRVTASDEDEIAFTGADAFEGEEGALEPPLSRPSFRVGPVLRLPMPPQPHKSIRGTGRAFLARL